MFSTEDTFNASWSRQQIEYTVAKQHVRNSESVEQIQDRARVQVRGSKSLMPLTEKNFSRFTELSGGMSGAKVEQTSSETLSFRCVCERCRLMRGDIRKTTRKVAFTLAETLITIGIIAVVAIMTIPNIVVKYKEKVYETGFKKEYSVLSNAINYVQLDNNLNECYFLIKRDSAGHAGYDAKNSDCQNLKNQIITQLKLVPVPKYSNFTPQEELIDNGGITTNNGVKYDHIVNLVNAYLTPDGTIIFFTPINHNSFEFVDVIFIIDTNGQKGPNKWGYDVFMLTLNEKNGILRLTDEYASLADKGGKLPRTILLNRSENQKYMNIWGLW